MLRSLNLSRSYKQFFACAHQFTSLRTLELTSGDYSKAAQPLLIPFQSQWVRNIPPAATEMHAFTLCFMLTTMSKK